ncbi:hypothetical protein CO540_16500 [Micromonospora sp. WMMA2032]|uniref:DUF6297 family protein n=1 Tax=Micromonospora sp. WMMA2032 TaxID=2039870 RepID=UPI000C05C7C0|nr:DUF6297 family protein [Micromonospora sp. WMMA2032]ATO15238.1 hypothetical protein CO540_16500 [Micromonospora sp. WMMA2032]
MTTELRIRPDARPDARRLRRWLRRTRRRHREASLGDLFTDAYVLVLFCGMYGWALFDGVRDYLGSPSGRQGDPGDRYWIGVAAALTVVGLAWRGLRAVGPLVVAPAAQSWVVSSPVDRRAWLLPRFVGLLVAAFAGGGLLGLASAAATGGGGAHRLAGSATAGAACATAAVALAVVAQASPRTSGWVRVLDRALFGVGAAVAATVVAGHLTGRSVPPPAGSVIGVVALVAWPPTVTAVVLAYRALPFVDRASLATGAQAAGAAAGATVMLDPSILTDLVESRRWRSIGRVASRRFRPLGRFGVLVQAELWRPVRHPSALVVWAALLLTTYAVAVALPASAGPAQVVLGFLAAGRLTGGLRAVNRSAGLRRALGGGDTLVTLAHLVVPAVAVVVWYAATLPAVRSGVGVIDGVLVLGTVAAAYRAGTRPPMTYGGAAADTPFGMIPIDLVRQVVRGPDVVGALVVAQMLWG